MTAEVAKQQSNTLGKKETEAAEPTTTQNTQKDPEAKFPRLKDFAGNVAEVSRKVLNPRKGNEEDPNRNVQNASDEKLNKKPSKETAATTKTTTPKQKTQRAVRLVNAAHAMAPQGILLHRVEKQAKKEAKQQAALEQEEDQVEESQNSDNDNNDESKEEELPTFEDRLKEVTAPSWPVLQKYSQTLSSALQFEEWWSYPVLILFFISPLLVSVLLLSVTAIVAAGCCLNDYVQTSQADQSTTELIAVYKDFTKEKLADFQAGAVDRKLLLVAAVVVQVMTRFIKF